MTKNNKNTISLCKPKAAFGLASLLGKDKIEGVKNKLIGMAQNASGQMKKSSNIAQSNMNGNINNLQSKGEELKDKISGMFKKGTEKIKYNTQELKSSSYKSSGTSNIDRPIPERIDKVADGKTPKPVDSSVKYSDKYIKYSEMGADEKKQYRIGINSGKAFSVGNRKYAATHKSATPRINASRTNANSNALNNSASNTSNIEKEVKKTTPIRSLASKLQINAQDRIVNPIIKNKELKKQKFLITKYNNANQLPIPNFNSTKEEKEEYFSDFKKLRKNSEKSFSDYFPKFNKDGSIYKKPIEVVEIKKKI